MAKTTAQNKQQVDEMTPQQRLWDSLSYSYGKQAEASDQSYDKAISQLNNSLLARGMQRSSYGASVNANLYNQKINAANDIGSQKIADYENRLYQLEKDEDERAYRDKAFDEQVRQYEQNFGYQKEQDALNLAFQKEQFDYSKMSDEQKLAYNYIVSAAANGNDVSDEMLARAGISREDYNALKTKTNSGGGVGYRTTSTDATSAVPSETTFEDALREEASGGTTGRYVARLTPESSGVAEKTNAVASSGTGMEEVKAAILADTKNRYLDQRLGLKKKR